MQVVKIKKGLTPFKKVEDLTELDNTKLSQMQTKLLIKVAKISAVKIARKINDTTSTFCGGGIFNVPSYRTLNQSMIFVDINNLAKGYKFKFNDLVNFAARNNFNLENIKKPASGLSIATIRKFLETLDPINTSKCYKRSSDGKKFRTVNEIEEETN